MPQIKPIDAIRYDAAKHEQDISPLIAPPYDVLDEAAKAKLLAGNAHNIVDIDLPHLPAKTVGPDEVYEQAGEKFRNWLSKNILLRQTKPALFVYQQTFLPPDSSAGTQPLRRKGLFANIRLQPFGPSKDGTGGVFPHEQTFSGPKEDRLKLMRATKAQLSPIFGLCPDNGKKLTLLLDQEADSRPADHFGVTESDGVKHEIWVVDNAEKITDFQSALAAQDVFIADGHHRYNTALNYKNELVESGGQLPENHLANGCLFVLVSMQDPGLFIGPTHRVVGGMTNFSLELFVEAAQGKLDIKPFNGDLEALEKALPEAGPHAIGLYAYDKSAGSHQLAIATTAEPDPLAATHGSQSEAWRELDVAIAQHLIVEQICEPKFAPPGLQLKWKFPHTLDELTEACDSDPEQFGLVMQPTALESVRKVSEAGELMPQKSTFFFPKIATGLVVNPLE